MLNRLRKFQRLTGWERWLLIQAALLLPISALAFRRLGLQRWQRILAWTASAFLCNLRNPGLTQARQMAAMVELAVRRSFSGANCLQRSLVLWWMLKRYGIAGDLKIGVRLNQQQCEAHAWVEYLGCVLNDSSDVSERFAPFAGAIYSAEPEI